MWGLGRTTVPQRSAQEAQGSLPLGLRKLHPDPLNVWSTLNLCQPGLFHPGPCGPGLWLEMALIMPLSFLEIRVTRLWVLSRVETAPWGD